MERTLALGYIMFSGESLLVCILKFGFGFVSVVELVLELWMRNMSALEIGLCTSRT